MQSMEDGHSLSTSGLYVTPSAAGDYGAYMTHLEALPYQDGPELFGLHPNADITFSRQVSTGTAA